MTTAIHIPCGNVLHEANARLQLIVRIADGQSRPGKERPRYICPHCGRGVVAEDLKIHEEIS